MSGSKYQQSNLFKLVRSRFEQPNSSDASNCSDSSNSSDSSDNSSHYWKFEMANQNATSDFINRLKQVWAFFLKLNGLEIWNLGFLGRWLRIQAQNLEIRNGGSGIGGPKWKNLLVWDVIYYSVVLRVADYESDLNIQKIKNSWNANLTRIGWNSVYCGFFGSLITNLSLTLRNSARRI